MWWRTFTRNQTLCYEWTLWSWLQSLPQISCDSFSITCEGFVVDFATLQTDPVLFYMILDRFYSLTSSLALTFSHPVCVTLMHNCVVTESKIWVKPHHITPRRCNYLLQFQMMATRGCHSSNNYVLYAESVCLSSPHSVILYLFSFHVSLSKNDEIAL